MDEERHCNYYKADTGHTKIHVALSLNIDENKYPRLAEDS